MSNKKQFSVSGLEYADALWILESEFSEYNDELESKDIKELIKYIHSKVDKLMFKVQKKIDMKLKLTKMRRIPMV